MTPPPVAEPAAPYERDPELCDEIIAEWRRDWADRLGKQPDGSVLWRVNASDIMRLVERIDAQAATLSAEIAARVKAEGERDEARAGRGQLINDTVQMGLARDDAERRADKAEARVCELEEALSGPAAWLERWATHIGSCRGGSVCTCGLTLARHEIAATLLADGQPKP